MSLPHASPGRPWYGVDDVLLRRFEIFETEVHGRGPGRRVIDLGDALGLFDDADPDPFYNRVGAIRWPHDETAFDARVDAVVDLFRAERREVYLWLSPAVPGTDRLAERLAGRGFVAVGDGALVLLLVRDPRSDPVRPIAGGTTMERLTANDPGRAAEGARAAAEIVAEAFGMDRERVPVLETELRDGLADPAVDLRLVRVDGEPAAVGRRHDADDLSYLSAIGVRTAFQGRGLGEAVTRALVGSALDAGRRWIYLGVYTDNARARATYERIGFATLGGPALELLLP